MERDEDGTIKENLIIKGNNLLALHSLKKQFAGKVKLIYIDPPYNTGNDGFKYNDNFNHSTWLSFMKNRLELAKELLRNDGVIFISIDDNEQAYLKVLMDEVFGRENFITNFIWTRKKKGSFLSKKIRKMTEFIVCYTKTPNNFSFYGEDAYSDKWQPIVKRTNSLKELKIPQNTVSTVLKDGIYKKGFQGTTETGIDFLNNFEVREGVIITNLDIKGRFVWTQDFLNEEIKNGSRISLSSKFGFNVLRYNQSEKIKTPSTLINQENGVGTNEDATQELAKIFGSGIGEMFAYNKPTSLLKYIINMLTFNEKNAIILDYHAGSGTTAHAVLDLNKEDGGNRQFILVEQMDYIETVTVPRVEKVIEQQGGGSFVYCELKEWNEEAKQKILACGSIEELETLFKELYERYFLNYTVSVKKFRETVLPDPRFRSLPLKRQQEMFCKMLDLNQMYVPVSEREDALYSISKEDLEVMEEFYGIL
ncbi:site-specific DNA-methyltransferase [Candidatus Peregrinibacteria bacterium]|nr:MAG: site-specific DNA-methyltransferase [Candidatus Peregrinibacteria bacterium]